MIQNQFAQQKLTDGVKFLLYAFGVIFLTQLIGRKFLAFSLVDLFAFSPQAFFSQGYLWSILSYAFLHGYEIFHILFNCLILWMIGPHLERLWGTKSFLKFFCLCAIGGALFHSLLWFVSLSVFPSFALKLGHAPIVGASGALFGLLYAFQRFFGNTQVLFFFVIPMTIKKAVALLIAIDLVQGIFYNDGVAHWIHIGGFVSGYLLIKLWGDHLKGQGPGLFRRKKPLNKEELKKRLNVIVNDEFKKDSKNGKYPITWN